MSFKPKKIIVSENFDMTIDYNQYNKWVLVKFKNSNDLMAYTTEEVETLPGYKKQKIVNTESMKYDTYSGFNHMDCTNGFCELKEGIFYFDWGNRIAHIIKWLDVSESKKLKIIRDIKRVFRFFNECDKDDYNMKHGIFI